MKDFFQQQEHARRQTRLLVVLMCLAVTAILGMVNAVAALIWHWVQGGMLGNPYPKGFFLTNSLVAAGLIAGGTLIELFNLRQGGDAVARMAGARLVPAATHDAQERRLQNVVAEMALASGLACPKVYVMDREESINAFAAGYNPNEAVVAVTRGALQRLTRDELQGVVAHEFSHILNGDMRLNIRLIGVLFGIQMIAGLGRHLIHSGANGSGQGNSGGGRLSPRLLMLALGVALYVAGYAGVFFGRLIKATVSRQREFLADASAVQFTRNRDGLGGALRKIGGLSFDVGPASRIAHPNAEQLSHLFLGAPLPGLMSGLLASHPAIEERLRRLYGRRIELLDAPPLPDVFSAPTGLPDIPYRNPCQDSTYGDALLNVAADTTSVLAAPFVPEQAGKVALPPGLDSALRDPLAAQAAALAVLLRKSGREHAHALLKSHAPSQADLAAYLWDLLAGMPLEVNLPILDLAMPALLQNPQQERRRFLATAAALIAADRRMTLDEFVVQTILARRLGPQAGRAIPVKYKGASSFRKECSLLLSLVAAARQSAAPGLRDGDDAGDKAEDRFMRGAAAMPELGLSAADRMEAPAINFPAVQSALERAASLAPLGKPALVKALLAASENRGRLSQASADVLRAVCSAIDAPMPPRVSAVYAGAPVLEPAWED